MYGDDNISLDEVKNDDNFNLASIYESKHTEDDSDVNYSLFKNTDSGECDYYEPLKFAVKTKHHNLSNNKHTNSYLHLNCRGLSSNWEKFQDLLCDVHSPEFSFDFIGLSEVFRCDRDRRISLPGYHPIITRCRDSNDGCRGGVAFFIKNTFDYKVRDDLSVFIPHVYESLFIELLLPRFGKRTIIGVVYRPNTYPLADVDIFTTTLLDVMDHINNEKKKGIIMGDMNIDILKYGSNPAYFKTY